MLNNLDLVVHAQKALSEKWGYVWGTFGQVLTINLLNQKTAQYPKEVGGRREFIQNTYLNRRVADCVGLIKSYLWWKGGEPVYDSKTDLSADGMYGVATIKGPMITFIGNMPGLLLWKRGHIGIYVGNDTVIEARGTTSGVISSKVNNGGWTHWLRCPGIKYLESGDIKTLQTKLNMFGYELTVDGIYGPITRSAVTKFQISNNLASTGIVTDETMVVINNMAERMIPTKLKTYVEILREYSHGRSEDWIRGINSIVNAASADGDLGDLEIFKFLPDLIENIGNGRKPTS
jgi:hypothetical protein